MMKMLASLVILGLCANVCFGYAPASSSQSGAFTASLLNSTPIAVVKVSNPTDAAVWDSSANAVTNGAAEVDAGISISSAWFGPGATNDTSYLWGFPDTNTNPPTDTYEVSSSSTGTNSIGSSVNTMTTSVIRKRTINNTIVAYGNDTVEASVVATDASISATILGSIGTPAVGPGYLAFLSTGYDSATGASNNQVWFTLVGTSATTTKLTTTADSTAYATQGNTCTYTTFTAGEVWYDRGTMAFYYTYSKAVWTSPSQPTTTSGATCPSFATSGSGAWTRASTIYLGGMYLNGTAVMTTPISVAAAVAANGVGMVWGSGDNNNAASNIILVYKDSATGIIYSSKTPISANTSTVGSFAQVTVAPVTSGTVGTASSGSPASGGVVGTSVAYTYYVADVWCSNATYGITVETQNATTACTGTAPASVTCVTTYVYSWLNFFNGSTSGVDSGLTTTSTTYGLVSFQAWQLNTGYTVVAGMSTATSANTYMLATYFANGTVNQTAATIGTLTYGMPQFYEDVNGTMWIGWFDQDIGTNGLTGANAASNGNWVYAAYLAKFQGQLNIASGVNVISVLSFVAVFLASIFIF